MIRSLFICQGNSFHENHADKQRQEILQQAANSEQNLPIVLLIHKLSENEAGWSILPIMPRFSATYGRNSSWIFFLEEETTLKIPKLLETLSRFDKEQGDPVDKKDIFIAVKTCRKFHKERSK
ncbi:UNVERIFIED_CONTAM: hypothetical protein FKN15_052331 [Acipenser sinensis]